MTLLEEIQNGENVALEFKEARPKDSLKFTKTVVAFANGRGGRILFGVEDKTGRLVGIPRDKVATEMDAIADTVANTCTPSVAIDLKPTTLEGKVLIALDVRSGDKTPYYVKSLGIRKGTFIRIGATTRNVEEHKLKSLIIAGENLSFDKQPVKGARVTKKDVEALCRMMTGLPPPTVSEEAGFFKVVFWRRTKDGNAQSAPTSVGDPVGNVGNPVGNVGDYDGKAIAEDANLEQVVMNCLRGDVKMSAAKIAKVANVTTRTIERALTRLKVSGRIRRKGGTRGVWEVIG